MRVNLVLQGTEMLVPTIRENGQTRERKVNYARIDVHDDACLYN